MYVELVSKEQVEFMFVAHTLSDIATYMKGKYNLTTCVVEGDTLVYTTSDTSITYSYALHPVDKFNYVNQTPWCEYIDLISGGTYSVTHKNTVPYKYQNAGKTSQSVNSVYSAVSTPWADAWGINKNLQVAIKCADLYTLEFLHREYPDDDKIKTAFIDISKELAQQFSVYLDMVIGGELRHANGQSNHADLVTIKKDSKLHKKIIDLLQTVGKTSNVCKKCPDLKPDCIPGKCTKYKQDTAAVKYPDISDRGKMWSAWYELRQEHGIALLQVAEDVYTKAKWGHSFGGQSWGKLVTALLRYYNKGYIPKGFKDEWVNDFMFVDMIWSMQHNGGNALNKVWVVPGTLTNILDYKFTGHIKFLVKYASTGVQTLWGEKTGTNVTVVTRLSDLTD